MAGNRANNGTGLNMRITPQSNGSLWRRQSLTVLLFWLAWAAAAGPFQSEHPLTGRRIHDAAAGAARGAVGKGLCQRYPAGDAADAAAERGARGVEEYRNRARHRKRSETSLQRAGSDLAG